MQGQRWLRAAGLLVMLVCLGFLGKTLLDLEPGRLVTLSIDGLLAALLLASACYTALLIAVVSGFAELARATGHARGTVADALVIWGKANAAKYLPGNVLHFAGRQVMGARRGWPQGTIAAASLLEIILQLVLPLAIGLLLLLRFDHLAMLEELVGLEGLRVWLLPVAAAFIVVALVALACLPRLVRLLPPRAGGSVLEIGFAEPARLWRALGWYLVFFLGVVLIVCALYVVVIGYINVHRLPIVAAAFLVAWVIGFVLPGAPGGVGVREGVFVALAGAFLPIDALLVTALAMRLVTLIGEALLFVGAVVIDRPAAHRATAGEARAATWRAR